MTPDRTETYRFALECASFELNQVRKMAREEGRLSIALNIENRIAELDELAWLLTLPKIAEVINEG